MVTLAAGTMRRVEILCTIRSYSVGQEWSDKRVALYDSILTRALRKMTAEWLLIREEKPGIFPPEVYYSLTPQVVESLVAMTPLVAWARAHPEIIKRAQAYSRSHSEGEGTGAGVADLGEVSADSDYGPCRRTTSWGG
jgi:DNA-binding HxlR family transcriptional regulator